MNVAICSDGVFPEAIGGMQRHTRLLAETIAREHPEVRLTVVHTHPGVQVFPDALRIREVAVEPRPQRRQYLVECFELADRFEAVLRDMPGSVVYSQGICVVKNIRAFTDRLIVNPHGLESFQSLTFRDWAKSTPFRLVQRRTFRHAKHLVSLGGRLTEILEHEGGRVPGKVVVIPNGVVVPEEQRVAQSQDHGPMKLLFVGRLASNKGVPDLLAAMDELSRRGLSHRFHLDIVGGGPMLEQLQASNCRPNVRLAGLAPDDQLEIFYRHADVLILPTLFEGMPTVVLEAMARSVPVLVTDVGASRELVDSTNGEIIPKRDPLALADALIRLERLGPHGRGQLGKAGRKKALERFTWKWVADAHVNLFERTLAK